MHQTIAREMDATIFFLATYDETSRTVQVVWQVENGEELSGGSFPLGTGLTSQVISSGEPRLIGNWSVEGPRVQVQYASPAGPSLPESAVAVPLKLAGNTIGLMCVESYRQNAYSYSNLHALEVLADEAAIVMAGLNYSERLGAQVGRRVSELEAILANMADALLIIDSRGCLVRLNRAARDLLCLDESTIVLGQPFEEKQWDNWPPEGRAAAEGLRPVVERLQQTQEPQEVEVELPGVRRVLSFRATPLHDVDGAFTGGVIVFRDVTGERDVERLKDDMFSMASHDLKTPATVIKVQAQRLKRRFNTGSAEQDDVEEGLTMIADQADRLSKLLNLLLDLSRIEAGRLSLDRTATDLRGMLISMARALQSTTDSHVIEVDAPMGVIGHWDARRLEEVIQNLLNNAVKYSPMGGGIHVRLRTQGQNAVVTIRDSGIGLASDDAPHVFERFFRGREIRRVEGAGLGLYICQAIIAAHGGRIWAQSKGPGTGSTFTFCLPLAE